ncbi:MAG: tetratricopeptide repeat protein [Proteobacteria bacterium]|nr:tetratricopeptide repeat protein [Pseudomonadota bacterium]
MPKDCRGLGITAASAEAAAAFDRTVRSYLAISKDSAPDLKATLGLDPEMPMEHIMKGYFFMIMATGPLKDRAKKVAAEAKDRAPRTTPRERLHAEALGHWVDGRKRAAIGVWEAILETHPLDVLALRLAHHGHFYEGDGQNLRDTVLRALRAWSSDVPGFGFVKGMEAFGREETHDYVGAIKAGDAAVEHEPENPWGIHAVAHVHEMRGDQTAGIAWIESQEPGWTGCNNFRYHLWWHRMLMHLDRGEYDRVLDLYDHALWDPESDEYLDLVNDTALLLRLELHDQDVGNRWQALAEKCAAHATDQSLAFIDVHHAIALSAAARPELDQLLAAMKRYAETSDDDNADTTGDIALPVAEAITAHRAGDFGRAAELLAPCRYRLHGMGGSHAQRDLFAMLLIDAAIKSGRTDLAKALLSERLGRQPGNAWTLAHAATVGL